MQQWIVQFAIDNVMPIILTILLGVLGVKLKHIKDALEVITSALADGKIDKSEWRMIRHTIGQLIGR